MDETLGLVNIALVIPNKTSLTSQHCQQILFWWTSCGDRNDIQCTNLDGDR